MDFGAPLFLFLYLPVFLGIYYVSGRRGRVAVGIVGSLLFYAWGNLTFLPLLLGILGVAYGCGWGIQRWQGTRVASSLVWLGVLVNVGVLVGFKFWDVEKYPLGLSYITFQALAYLFEVNGGKVEREGNVFFFAFYLLFFPKLPVGPIVRYSQVRDQIRDLQVQPDDVAEGLRRFIVGFAKKALIADTLAKTVNPVFELSSPAIAPALAWLVLIAYALQLYFDFSGYTDMALGLGRMLGLRLPENFNHPYLSRNIGEFWRRWHISLSSWFRDFVFYPLERKRIKWGGQALNILVVFLLTGLWHGISRTFVIWGLIHGLALVFESTALGRKLRTSWAPLQHMYALGVILVSWVFFRSPGPGFALEYLWRLVGDSSGLQVLPFSQTSPLPLIEPTFVLALLAGLAFSVPTPAWLARLFGGKPALQLAGRLAGDLLLVLLLLAAIAAAASSGFTPVIYGNF